MIILLIIIMIGLLVFVGTKSYQEYEDIWDILTFFVSIILGILIIAFFIILVAYPYNIDKKLNMYQEENNKIETKVKDTVQSYMNYEKETYQSLVENANLETLLVKYPELNSNELVKSEIETYKENSKKIKDLKEQKINKNVYDFWLNFNIVE